MNKKKLIMDEEHNTYKLRISHRKRKGKTDACYTIKCGDCDRKFEIYYGGKYGDERTLEIAGVFAGIEEWKRILLPLLK